jgi:hypothetical protein
VIKWLKCLLLGHKMRAVAVNHGGSPLVGQMTMVLVECQRCGERRSNMYAGVFDPAMFLDPEQIREADRKSVENLLKLVPKKSDE